MYTQRTENGSVECCQNINVMRSTWNKLPLLSLSLCQSGLLCFRLFRKKIQRVRRVEFNAFPPKFIYNSWSLLSPRDTFGCDSINFPIVVRSVCQTNPHFQMISIFRSTFRKSPQTHYPNSRHLEHNGNSKSSISKIAMG